MAPVRTRDVTEHMMPVPGVDPEPVWTTGLRRWRVNWRELVDWRVVRGVIVGGITAPFRHWKYATITVAALFAINFLGSVLSFVVIFADLGSSSESLADKWPVTMLLFSLAMLVPCVPFLTGWHRVVMQQRLGNGNPPRYLRLARGEAKYLLCLLPLYFLYSVDGASATVARAGPHILDQFSLLMVYDQVAVFLGSITGSLTPVFTILVIPIFIQFICLVFPASAAGHRMSFVGSFALCRRNWPTVVVSTVFFSVLIFLIGTAYQISYGSIVGFVIGDGHARNINTINTIITGALFVSSALFTSLFFLLEAAFLSVLYRNLQEKAGDWPEVGNDGGATQVSD